MYVATLAGQVRGNNYRRAASGSVGTLLQECSLAERAVYTSRCVEASRGPAHCHGKGFFPRNLRTHGPGHVVQRPSLPVLTGTHASREVLSCYQARYRTEVPQQVRIVHWRTVRLSRCIDCEANNEALARTGCQV